MKNIKALKELFVKSSSLSEIFDYFFGLIEEQGIFGDKISPQHQSYSILPAIQNMTQEIVKQKLDKTIHINGSFFFEEKKQHCLHGTFIVKNNPFPLTVCFFSDIQIGAIAFVSSDNPTNTEFFRFHLAKKSDFKIPN